jgi:hypothetical protein
MVALPFGHLVILLIGRSSVVGRWSTGSAARQSLFDRRATTDDRLFSAER